MGKQAVCAIRDLKIHGFQFPQFALSVGDALRRFASAVNDQQTMICMHPADFELWHVGDWDTETGCLECFDAPRRLGGALEYKRVSQQTELPLNGQEGK